MRFFVIKNDLSEVCQISQDDWNEHLDFDDNLGPWRTHARIEHWEDGDIEVSTIFAGLDGHMFRSIPPLFTTIVFNGDLDGEQNVYHTLEQARAGHIEMVKRVKAKIRPKTRRRLGQ